MTDEELKYYKALQPLFKEKMGAWQEGDWYYNPEIKRELPVSMRWWSPCVGAIMLPLPIDSGNPERGLLGMFSSHPSLHFNGFMPTDKCWVCHTYSIDGMRTGTYYAATPTLAFLKALAEQEGRMP